MKRAPRLSHGTCCVALALMACADESLPPEGQFIVHIATDAPLPAGYGQAGLDTVPLFDRLAVDVFPPGASEPCEACRREFAVDADLMNRGDASVGVIPGDGRSGVRIRARLFRADLDAPAPRPSSTLERVVWLPAAPAQGIEHVTVLLAIGDVGQPVGTLEAPVSVVRGRPDAGLVGSWPGSRRVGCIGSSAADEVCVPGGPFWLGDPRLDLSGAAEYQGATERLVLLSPFHLDKTEVTVAAFRTAGLAESTASGVINPMLAGPGNHCTYTDSPGPGDDLPVNCLTWRLARAYCEKQGKRLPTEAELAYASSALGTSSYVWGEDPPACGDAVFGRNEEDDRCAAWGLGVAVPGSGQRDRLRLDDGQVLDLAGNVMEYAADFWQLDHEACWSGAGILSNPVCDLPSHDGRIGRTVRGGAYVDPPLFLRSALRTVMEGESKATSSVVGFRCARDGH